MSPPRVFGRFRDRLRHRGGPWAALFEPYDGDECVSVDCETTSLDPRTAQLLTIGAVRVRGRRVMTSTKLDLRLRPPEHIDHESMRVHGLRGWELADGLRTEDALRALLEFVGNRPLLGFYIAFDVAVIDRHIEPMFGFRLPNRTIELSQVYRGKLSATAQSADPDLRLETIAAKLDMPPFSGRHTAVGDAIGVATMYVRLRQRDRIEL